METPQRDAKISVWPGNLCPARFNDSLCNGAVTIPATSPESAKSIARFNERNAASPPAAQISPKRTEDADALGTAVIVDGCEKPRGKWFMDDNGGAENDS